MAASDGTVIAVGSDGQIHAGIPTGVTYDGTYVFGDDIFDTDNIYMGEALDSVPSGSGPNPLDIPNVGYSSGVQAANARIRQLQDEIAQLRASASSRGAIYRDSGIDIYDSNNNLVFHAGPDGTTIKENLTLGANLIGKNAFANQMHISGFNASVSWDTNSGQTITPISKTPTDYCPLYVTPPDFAQSAFITYTISGQVPGDTSLVVTPYLGSQEGESFTRETIETSTWTNHGYEQFTLAGQFLVSVDAPDSSGKLALGCKLSRTGDGSSSYTAPSDSHMSIGFDINFTVFWCAEGVITNYTNSSSGTY